MLQFFPDQLGSETFCIAGDLCARSLCTCHIPHHAWPTFCLSFLLAQRGLHILGPQTCFTNSHYGRNQHQFHQPCWAFLQCVLWQVLGIARHCPSLCSPALDLRVLIASQVTDPDLCVRGSSSHPPGAVTFQLVTVLCAHILTGPALDLGRPQGWRPLIFFG